MTLGELYLECRKKLTHDTADFDLSQLLTAQFGSVPSIRSAADPVSAVFQVPPSVRRPEMEVSAEDAFVFQMKVKRLADGYPLQYLLGEWEFYSVPLKVGEGVLIPRPDTETLVDAALALLAGRTEPVIADLCSGSGAIALAIAKNHPDAKVYAVEVSPEAPYYLYENIEMNKLGGRVEAISGDVFETLALPPLDLLVSNPPYLTARELEELDQTVRYEPALALDGGEDGLRFYRRISETGSLLLRPGGTLMFEVGYQQADAVASIMRDRGYGTIAFQQDLNQIRRCVSGVWPITVKETVKAE